MQPSAPRAASVARDDFFDSSLRSLSSAAPSRNAIHFRAASVAPATGNGLNGNERHLSPGRSLASGRALSPGFRRANGRSDFDGDFSLRDVVSVTRSVTGRAAELPILSAGLSLKLSGQKSRFMTLEEECNWILSGREPLPPRPADGGDGEAGSDGEDDDTLDDISGDEVRNFEVVFHATFLFFWKNNYLSIFFFVAH